MIGKYKLVGHEVEPVADLIEWAMWYQTADRRVEHDQVGETFVLTDFMGLDLRFLEHAGPPVVFETYVSGGRFSGYVDRYRTWNEAVAGHAKALAMVRGE